jgi:hypothetical protein
LADVYLGIDLSLLGLGLCAVPAGWDRDFRQVRATTLEYKLPKTASAREQIARLRALALDVRRFADRVHATVLTAEDIPPHAKFSVVVLAELRAAVRFELTDHNYEVEFVNASDARRLLYGRDVPRGLTPAARKAWLTDPVLRAGGRFDDHNQVDAFAIANWSLWEVDEEHFSNLVGPVPPKPKRSRARKGQLALA